MALTRIALDWMLLLLQLATRPHSISAVATRASLSKLIRFSSKAATHSCLSTMSASAPTAQAPPLRPIICPSLLSCDLARLAHDAKQMIDMGAEWLHMDIMDGHFVPNLSFGPPVIASLHSALPDAYLDCHLMVSDPAFWVEPLQKAGATSLTFHLESNLPNDSPVDMIAMIRSAGMKVGMVIKPGTPVDALYEYADRLDLILIMTVEPGFSGQAFMPDMMPKVKELRARFPHLTIQVDGGLSPSTVDAAAEAGANAIVAASAIFGAVNRQEVIDQLRASVERHLPAP